MPGKEGLQTIKEIMALNSRAKIIAMSSGGAGHVMSFLEMAKKIGASRIINKPVKPGDLLNAVRALLGNS